MFENLPSAGADRRSIMFDMTTRRRLLGGLALAGIAAATASHAAWAQTAAPDNTLNISRFAGRVLYVDFWASWCGPCQQSFPFMANLIARYRPADFALVAVNTDHSRDDAERFLQRYGGGVPVVYDASHKIAPTLGVKDMPTSILFGRDGRKRYVHQGFHEQDTPAYEAHIAELIHEK